MDNNNYSSSNTANNNNNSSAKGLQREKALSDKYFCEGFPNKLMMEALKELNINGIKVFLMARGPDKTEQL